MEHVYSNVVETGGAGGDGGGALAGGAHLRAGAGGATTTSDAGSTNSNGAAGGDASLGSQAGATDAAGAAGAGEVGGAGEITGSGEAGEPAAGCVSVTECPRPANACLVVRCSQGSCVTDYAPAGSLYVLDAPADCHATTACDGAGNPTLVVDQSNWPTPTNPCLTGTCNNAGVAGTEPLRSGSPCSADFGPGKCDGAGKCVACLATPDCPLGQICTAKRTCVGQPCSDSNCGGACPACVGSACATDNDCASRSCVPASKLCRLDPLCVDQIQDGNETDVDCGGGACPPCTVGKACSLNVDCGSVACDALSFVCVADACSDHRMDSDESDLDCGGGNMACARCGPSKKCYSNFDCVSGHFCNGSKVCQ